ncbi:hypothetical protein PMZ80_002460 [Knufia obscura]|uniref:Uncharacterized protein n=1 Tax=Knufia obscura TaxID=1635080 RepID=A0ABR0RXE4_9EURO|nr:hypothetical protein PMZ80_002460 [Knufia obscura]
MLFTGVFLDGSGVLPIPRIRGGEAYEAFMNSTLNAKSGPQRSSADDIATLQHALRTLRDEARTIKGDKVSIGGITWPSHFNSSQYGVVFQAAHKLDPAFGDFVRTRPSWFGSLVTYPKEHCPPYLYEDDRLADDDDPVALLFEVGFGMLRIVLALISPAGTSPVVSESVRWPTDEESIRSVLHSDAMTSDLGRVVSVVFSSADDPDVDWSQVRGVLEADFPELAVRVKAPPAGFDYVSATGAACVARQLAVHQRASDELDSAVVVHDEL